MLGQNAIGNPNRMVVELNNDAIILRDPSPELAW
jgi:hypothetical protein